MSDASTPSRSGSVSPVVFVLSVLLTVAGTAAVMLLLRPELPRPTGEANAPGTVGVASHAVEPLTQKDAVSPKREAGGRVVYPIPFAVPPSLKLTAAKREYVIVTQDEYGFTWGVRPVAEDLAAGLSKETAETLLKNPIAVISSGNLKPGLVYEDFTWEAKGVHGHRLPVVYEQTGTFETLPNVEGEVAYPIPFGQPANVELTGGGNTTVTEARANGFKWKNVTEKGKEFFGTGRMTWKARGIRGEGK